MSARESLISELEDAIDHGSNGACVAVLRRVTDLFLSAEHYDEEQIALYDDIIGRLIVHIETKALAELSERLAPIDHAPPKVIEHLVFNEEISVAGPILSQSNRVGESVLITIARTRSQAHLLAISDRKQLNEPVTDVLVDRGDAQVARKVVANPGARFSEPGFNLLAKRAETDEELAESILRRPEVPLHIFSALLARATDIVRQRLLAATQPEVHAEVQRVVAKASGEVAAEAAISRNYATALRRILLTHAAGKLTERDVLNFAEASQFEETVAALSVFCAVPIEVVDQVMCGDRTDTLLILCKAADFEWATVRAIVKLRPSRRLSAEQLVEICDDFAKLSHMTAQKVLRFWQNRQARAN